MPDTADSGQPESYRLEFAAGILGVTAPGVVMALETYGYEPDFRYAVSVFVFTTLFHGGSWAALAAIGQMRLGRRMMYVFAIGSWVALVVALIAIGVVDHPYVYIAVYVNTAAAITFGAMLGKR